MTVRDYSEGLKFAVMLNSMQVQKWQYEAIESLLKVEGVKAVLIILRDNEAVSKISFWQKMIHYPWHQFLFKKYYQFIFRPESFRPKALDELLNHLPIVKCQVLKKRMSEYFRDQDLDAIATYNPDFILKFGFGIIKGEILTCTPLGVWSFHHSDEQKYRGVPPSFWEIVNNDTKTGAILQRITDKLDKGIILRKGLFKTINHSWKANLDQTISYSINWPADVCREILVQHTFPDQPEGVDSIAPLMKTPGNTTFLLFLLKLFFNKIRFHLDEIFRCEIWQTGIMKARTADILGSLQYVIEPEETDWLSAKDKNSYYADGFAIREHDRLLLFFENYNYRSRKGHISVSWFNERDNTFSNPTCSLEEPWHLSYPFIFKSGNDFFCLPESKTHGSLELYRLEPSTLKMTRVRTLIEGIEAVDPTLVFHQNHWYLFFMSGAATNVELQIWHAETLDGPFVPHALNPVKSNVGNARPAGPLFFLDRKLYRPAQDCSRTYGGRIIINEVKILTEDSFLEMAVGVLDPPKGFEGIHNLSFAGDYMYFDCKKMAFSRANFFYQLKRKFGLARKTA